MVINNPDTERLTQLSDKWEICGMIFEQSTHFIKYYNGRIFASYQDRNMEQLCVGTIDTENDCINWTHKLKGRVRNAANLVFWKKMIFWQNSVNFSISCRRLFTKKIILDQILTFDFWLKIRFLKHFFNSVQSTSWWPIRVSWSESIRIWRNYYRGR